MSFTIAQTFDLLFDQSAKAVVPYEGRRWFRRPRPAGPDSDGGAEAAEDLLSARVGTCGWTKQAGPGKPPKFVAARHLPPRQPYDVFAAAAYLVEQASIYHHIQPQKMLADDSLSCPPPDPDLRHIDITAEDRRLVAQAAAAWREIEIPAGSMVELANRLVATDLWTRMEPLFESWWIVFAACADRIVTERPLLNGKPDLPLWWKHAWRLLAIADEAASGTGFIFDMAQMKSLIEGGKTDISWFEGEVLVEHVLRSLQQDPIKAGDGQPLADFRDIQTLSAARPAILNVLPKVRTPSVGCTLRSISHHLALLPPSGVVRAGWTPNYKQRVDQPGTMPHRLMNLVLVPLPYSLGARSFKKALVEDVSTADPASAGRGGTPRFGYFDVHQDWLDGPDFVGLLNFVTDVILAARAQSPEIHGLIFPELSLDFKSFQAVRDKMRDLLPEAEILIGGVSSNEAGRKGNFVATSTFPAAAAPTASAGVRETLREKHHRWKLDQTQLRDYGLLGALSPELAWWENISLQSRQVNFTVMRRDSVFAAMICEDLARVDPCQQVIRAIGPNLVVALLMDAPQIEARWPVRYATVLAEDPGCAALTLTSRGLMTLQHRLGTYRSNGDDRVIGLWRDDGGTRPVTLKCPYDSQAVLLTIVEQDVEDIALDGRVDRNAKAWRYVGHVPVRITKAKELHSSILGPEDLSCW